MHVTPLLLSRSSPSVRRPPTESVERFLSTLTHSDLGNRGLTHLAPCLSICAALTSLYLFSNRITSESLAHLSNLLALEQIYLQDNDIDNLLEMPPLPRLKVLNLSGNRLARLEGLHGCTGLEVLRLDGQRDVESVELDEETTREVLGNFLKELTLTRNRLSNPFALRYLRELEVLDLSETDFGDGELISTFLRYRFTSLATLSLLNTPLSRTTPSHALRALVILSSPLLSTLDGKEVTHMERRVALGVKKRREMAERRAAQATEGGTITNEVETVEEVQEDAPDPHLPRYATQYRDHIIHKISHAALQETRRDAHVPTTTSNPTSTSKPPSLASSKRPSIAVLSQAAGSSLGLLPPLKASHPALAKGRSAGSVGGRSGGSIIS